jgi:catechol 2,3-dioxygenase-like lactoylglutathione lyase family enzyme
MLRIGSIVLRVDDMPRQKAFWTAALGYVAREGDGDDFALLRPRDGNGPNVSLDRVRSTVQIPPRIHLDLYTEDQAGEVKRLIALGATEVHWDKRRRTRTTSSSRTLKATGSASSTRPGSDPRARALTASGARRARPCSRARGGDGAASRSRA